MDNKDIVYYYCDVFTFVEIIKNSTIWLSDVQKSNDYQECVLCKNRVHEIVQKRVDVMRDSVKERWKEEQRIVSCSSTYCVCFSHARDSLQMWLEYGNKAQGIAIGFDRHLLDSFSTLSLLHTRTGDVIYENKEQEKFISSISDDICRKLEQSTKLSAVEVDTNYLLSYPFVKDSTFSGEKEYRLVLSQGFAKTETYNRVGGFNVRGLFYRAKKSDIVSYYELDFSEIKKQLLHEIIIGGKAETTVEDVYWLLYRYGYYNDVSGSSYFTPYNICVSKCTYR